MRGGKDTAQRQGRGHQRPEPREGKRHTRKGKAGKKKKGAGRQKKTQSQRPRPRPRPPGARKHKKPRTAGARAIGEGGIKKRRKGQKGKTKPKQAEPEPGRGRARKKGETSKGKVRRTKTRPGGRPARPGREEHAQAHTRGTWAWHPPTLKGRCRRPHETAPVHRSSPASKDGRYWKPDASVTGSTNGKPPQRTQPKTEDSGTRQGQPHRGYKTDQSKPLCLGRGQQQAP